MLVFLVFKVHMVTGGLFVWCGHLRAEETRHSFGEHKKMLNEGVGLGDV